jgi:hypothetical protein
LQSLVRLLFWIAERYQNSCVAPQPWAPPTVHNPRWARGHFRFCPRAPQEKTRLCRGLDKPAVRVRFSSPASKTKDLTTFSPFPLFPAPALQKIAVGGMWEGGNEISSTGFSTRRDRRFAPQRRFDWRTGFAGIPVGMTHSVAQKSPVDDAAIHRSTQTYCNCTPSVPQQGAPWPHLHSAGCKSGKPSSRKFEDQRR